MKKCYLLFITLILFVLQIDAQADLIGRYLGLNQMVEKADTIALIKIESEAVYDYDKNQWLRRDELEGKIKKGEIVYDPRFGTRDGIYTSYFVSPIQIIKGSFGNLTIVPIELCMLQFNDMTTPATFHADTIDRFIMQNVGSIQPGKYALVFLQTSKMGNQNQMQSFSYPGSVIIISRQTAGMKYDVTEPLLKVKSVILHEMQRTIGKP